MRKPIHSSINGDTHIHIFNFYINASLCEICDNSDMGKPLISRTGI